MTNKNHKKRGPDWGVSSEDLDLYVKTCNHLMKKDETGRRESDKEESGVVATISLNVVAQRLRRPISAISQCLDRLETLYKTTLIDRKHRHKVEKVTGDGYFYYRKFRELVNEFEKLKQGPDKKSISTRWIQIGVTNSFRVHILPGAIAAHVLRLRYAGLEEFVRIHVEEGNYPNILQKVRSCEYDFGIGWEIPEKTFPQNVFEPLINTEVPFGVIVPDPKILKCDEKKFAPLIEMFSQENEVEMVRSSWLKRMIGKKGVFRIATVGTFYHPKLERLLAETEQFRRIVVKNFEDVLAFVRMQLADLGIVPNWYAKRQYVKFRQINEGNFSRKIMVYRKREYSRRKVHQEQELKPLDASDQLLDTIRKFFKDNIQNGETTNFEYIVKGKKIEPADVKAWAEDMHKREPLAVG